MIGDNKNRGISLICTVKNEEDSIEQLLDSIICQSIKPDEVVIVDGGSTDETLSLIVNHRIMKILPVKLIEQHANISKGRNIAISLSEFEIIASTDGGCKLDENWLEKITAPFVDPNTHIVSGVYLPLYTTNFEKIASMIIFPDINKLSQESFLPSSRSIAFRKNIWAIVGGYPESLETAEDTLFDLRIKHLGFKFKLVRDAIVYWRVRSHNWRIFKQYYRYAKGEGLELLFTGRYVMRYLSYLLMLVLISEFWHNIAFWPLAGFFVLFLLWLKYLRKIAKPERIPIAISVAISIEIGLIMGYTSGVLSKLKARFMKTFKIANLSLTRNTINNVSGKSADDKYLQVNTI